MSFNSGDGKRRGGVTRRAFIVAKMIGIRKSCFVWIIEADGSVYGFNRPRRWQRCGEIAMPPQQQRVARPAARYRPGKAPANAHQYDSEEEEENEEQQQQQHRDHQHHPQPRQTGISSYASTTSHKPTVAAPTTQLVDEDSSEYGEIHQMRSRVIGNNN